MRERNYHEPGRDEPHAVIVEGYMDVILAHQYGFNNVVASMGVAITVAGTIYTVSTPGLSGTQAPLFASLTDELTYDNGVEWICSGPAGTRKYLFFGFASS